MPIGKRPAKGGALHSPPTPLDLIIDCGCHIHLGPYFEGCRWQPAGFESGHNLNPPENAAGAAYSLCGGMVTWAPDLYRSGFKEEG
jgi:hypothetical protein